MEKIINYDIITYEGYVSNFIDLVRNICRNGWTPIGGADYKDGLWTQTIVKYEDKSNNWLDMKHFEPNIDMLIEIAMFTNSGWQYMFGRVVQAPENKVDNGTSLSIINKKYFIPYEGVYNIELNEIQYWRYSKEDKNP